MVALREAQHVTVAFQLTTLDNSGCGLVDGMSIGYFESTSNLS